MQSDDEPAPSTLESANQSEVPQGVLPVHDRAEKLGGNCFQLNFGSVLECHLAHVAPKFEFGVIFPTGQAESEGSGHDAFEIAREKRQLRLDELEALFKSNFTLEDANARYVERHAFPFQMQEDRITPGKAVTLLMVLHRYSPPSLIRRGVQFANENRCVSFVSLRTL